MYCYFYVNVSFNYIVMRCYIIFILTLIYFVKDWRGKLIQRQAPKEEIVTTGIQKENRINIQKIKFEENMDFLQGFLISHTVFVKFNQIIG